MKSKPITSSNKTNQPSNTKLIWTGLAVILIGLAVWKFSFNATDSKSSNDRISESAASSNQAFDSQNSLIVSSKSQPVAVAQLDVVSTNIGRDVEDSDVTLAAKEEEEETASDKQLSERERRLKSLAKSVEKEERPDTPTFSTRKRKGNSITFDDIKFEMEKGDRFTRDMLTDSINDLVGKRLKLKGYIRPSIKQRGLTKFIFVRDDKECCFGPGAALYDCVLVTLEKGLSSDFTVRPITVEGEFYLKEFEGPDGKIWAVYRMKNGKVK